MKSHRLALAVPLLALALLIAGPAQAQEEGAEPPAPLLTVEEVIVEPSSPAADTLCRLRVKLRNRGDKVASRLGFTVRLNGQELGVYGNQLFMYPVPPGAVEEIPLYNFWSTESSRPMPAGGKLKVEVTLTEAVWTKSEMEKDDQGEIEVWTPLGAVPGLPVGSSVTLEMRGGSPASSG